LDIHRMEERYKKYIEKAKSVIRTLDPKPKGGEAAVAHQSAVENSSVGGKDFFFIIKYVSNYET